MPPVSVLLVLTLTAWARATDYCAVCSDHTMCQFPTEGPADSCLELLEQGLAAGDKEEILAAHNAIRSQVKAGNFSGFGLPAAQVMPNLTWNEELATVAQRWADQCDFKHDTCRNLQDLMVGQNLAAAFQVPWMSKKSWTSDAVNPWFFDELEKFIQTDLTFTEDIINTYAEHLTQVIWADTTTIGCGYIAFKEVRNHILYGQITLTLRHYVCNYGPTGNIVGQQIYQPA